MSKTITNPEEDRLITRKKAAARLDVSTRTVDRMASNGELPRIYVRSRPRFRESDIEKILRNGL